MAKGSVEKKVLSHLVDVGSGGGGGYGDGVWVNPLKKENLLPISIFQVMLNEVLIICEKWYLLMGKS